MGVMWIAVGLIAVAGIAALSMLFAAQRKDGGGSGDE